MSKSILKDKSFQFSLRLVKLCQALQNEKREYIISKQLLRSGTAIGALVREAEFGQSRIDFAFKMNIALKEANETDYWLHLLIESGNFADSDELLALSSQCVELLAMLVATVKTARKNNSG